jgi:FADH2 O2-dependent halogenase
MSHDYDVVVIGGGPAGSVLGSLLAQAGHSALILERDIHPRDHVGESFTPSSNVIWERIGFLAKMEEAGFVHKPGAPWTAPRAPVGQFFAIHLTEFPIPGSPIPYTFNVERDVFDTMLIRHAHELGAKVLQGVGATKVLFEGERATGVTVKVAEGWERDVTARFVVDATGRRSILANQLGLRRNDPEFNQFAIWSWFRGVEPIAEGYEGYQGLHFLGLEQAWAWQIPIRHGLCSVGVVAKKPHFAKSGRTHQEFFDSLISRNRSLAHLMRSAERVKPWWIEGDYSYKIVRLSGPGWLMVGDALRFVDPIFSTGVDVASYSAMHAHQAISDVLGGRATEAEAFAAWERRVTDGVDAWYDLISIFYKLQNLFTAFAVRKRFRENVVRIIQGNLYIPETVQRAREMIEVMEEAYVKIMADPNNLLRVGALDPEVAA